MLWRILLNLRADRDRPPLEQLDAEQDPERFLWRILPHAARTFSFCIVFLPRRSVRALAVAYLYCRILDTYEDLAATVEEKTCALREFAARFSRPAAAMGPTRSLDPDRAEDDRDRAHLLLVRHVSRVDQIFQRLPGPQQEAIRRLVRRMARGMSWAATVFDRQDGALRDGGQLSEYCWHVLGTTMLFAEEMQCLDQGRPLPVGPQRLEVCAAAGETIQLANVTRDVDKDFVRGVVYHPALRPGVSDADQRARARRALLLRALQGGDSLRALVQDMPFPRFSRARGAAFLLVLTTYAYYRKACRRAGLRAFREVPAVGVLRGAGWYLQSVLSAERSRRLLARLAGTLREEAARELRHAPAWEGEEDLLAVGHFDVVAALSEECP